MVFPDRKENKMGKSKRILSIMLCIVTVLTALPLSAAAKQKDEPYAEIKFDNAERENIPHGETEAFYLDYSAGDCENYEIVWKMSNPTRWPMEEITDAETGLVKAVRVEGTYTGYFTLSAEIISSEGEILASTERRIWVVAPDTRTPLEKFEDKLSEIGFTLFFITGFIILPIVATPISIPLWIISLISDGIVG